MRPILYKYERTEYAASYSSVRASIANRCTSRRQRNPSALSRAYTHQRPPPFLAPATIRPPSVVHALHTFVHIPPTSPTPTHATTISTPPRPVTPPPSPPPIRRAMRHEFIPCPNHAPLPVNLLRPTFSSVIHIAPLRLDLRPVHCV